ncbi:hypothetical protein D9M72_616800 [compost metagenome]
MFAERLAAAGDGGDVLDHLGHLPLQIGGEGMTGAKADDPDLAGAENGVCRRRHLGLGDGEKGRLDVGHALRHM